jgi:periplasmic protein CpxP/Spy
MRENAREMDREFQSRLQSLDRMNAEDNIKYYATIAEHHARATQRLVPAFDALYVKLSDSQRKAADEIFRDAANRTSTGSSNG